MKAGGRGLTLGKFAPLHGGHQFLLKTALASVAELWVIIYDCPETTDVPLNVRAGWIRRLYPSVRVIEAWDGPTAVGHTPRIKKRHEDYILHRLKIRGITHFFSSEFYGAHMSRALGAEDVRVDPERKAVPVSATRIRRDPFGHRRYLHPLVYRDLVINVALLGAPGAGKTTLAKALAAHYRTVWMPEYGREYWMRHQKNRRLRPDQLVAIARTHLAMETGMLHRANRFLFTDTNALTTRIFAHHYHGAAAPELEALADRAAGRHDLVFLCDIDFPCPDTWDRSGPSVREVFHKRIMGDLAARRIPHVILSGDPGRRLETARGALDRFRKYLNPLDNI